MNAAIILAARREAQESFDSRTLSGKVWQLCDEHFAQVALWLWEKEPLEAVESRCKNELGLPEAKAPSKSGLGRFWRPSEPELRGFYKLLKTHNRNANKASSAELVSDLEKSPSEFAKANSEKLQEALYEALEDGADPAALKPLIAAQLRLIKLELDRERIALDSRKLAILEKRDAAIQDTLNNKELTPEERERKQREIFGMA